MISSRIPHESWEFSGYVENLEDGTVKVVCDGDGAKLETFISRVNVQKDFIAVPELAVSYEAPTGEFTLFRIKYGDLHEELGDLLDAGFGLLAGKIDAGREENKQDQMLEKQDTTIGAIESLSEQIDHGKDEIVSELRTVRVDLKTTQEARFAKIEDEIAEIKAKIGMV